MKYFHTAISVSNLEKSQAFYEKVFDLEFDSKGERPDLKIKIINLKDKNGNVIELFKHEKPVPLQDDLMDFQKVGIKHIAFIVDNLEEAVEKAVSHGAKIIWPIKEGITVKRLAFVSDPNGIPIELIELRK
ncbi:MAG: Glyoxalase/bleomycin resistance protein/dioxygenase [Parcubacteria group bacterium GW2011_GWF2_38_8]|nr:MAG: Glyoxalase/bleomycin resistance protein/dioxygenase [Parcubacteria group bacterium GW2011_GWF2_38_8]